MTRKGKILIVEDVVISAKFIAALLEKHGITSDHAETGKEAIEKLQESAYDLVVMELNLSGMNGYETAVYIREILKNPVPIVALTSAISEDADQKYIQAGMNGILLKPVREEALLAEISKLQPTGKTNDDEQFIDLSFLEKTMRGNKDIIAQTMTIFLKYLPENLQDVVEGVEQENFSMIRLAAHKMKSSVSIVGLNKIEKQLIEMEQLALSELEMKRITELKNSVILLCDRAIAEINELKKQYEE